MSMKIFPEAGNFGSMMKHCQLAGQEQMEIDEADLDLFEAMEIDTLPWKVKERMDQVREKAMRLRRAKLQKKVMLMNLENLKQWRIALNQFLADLIVDSWQREQSKAISTEMLRIKGLSLVSTWDGDLEEDKTVEQ